MGMEKMRRSALYLLLDFVLRCPLIGQEEGGQGSEPAVIPVAVKETFARLLPEPSEVGASRSGEQKFFIADLYQYIDGGADTYLCINPRPNPESFLKSVIERIAEKGASISFCGS